MRGWSGLATNKRGPQKRPCVREPSIASSSYRKAGNFGSPALSRSGSSPCLNFIVVLGGMSSQRKQRNYIHLLVRVCLKVGDAVNGAQRPGRDNICPATPGLGGAWVHNSDMLMQTHCQAAIFIGWKICFRDEQNDIILDPLCVQLFGLICG